MSSRILSTLRESAPVARALVLIAAIGSTGCGPFDFPEEQSPACTGARGAFASAQGTITLAVPGTPTTTTNVASDAADAGSTASLSALDVEVGLAGGADSIDNLSANIGSELDSVWIDVGLTGAGSYSLGSDAVDSFYACPCTAGDGGETVCPLTTDDAGGGLFCPDANVFPITGTLDVRSTSTSDFKATLTVNATDDAGTTFSAMLSITYTGGPFPPPPGCDQDE